MINAKITGVGGYVPEKVYDNAYMESIVDKIMQPMRIHGSPPILNTITIFSITIPQVKDDISY